MRTALLKSPKLVIVGSNLNLMLLEKHKLLSRSSAFAFTTDTETSKTVLTAAMRAAICGELSEKLLA